ncbi:Sulfate transport system permease protein CysW [Posidoniimonas polymericola]|uniref:Sulfate transport system permease protein CysW n=1 Tax=Posidoniimonas polymericola TaxID=2528002 RepID=A0A5C5YL81_9BACT|nr:ABC transporter permease [Posidoniimonas polymericola]TWT75548.1 Sulfate transport system permease protein CysW [Posidoniimonas polymericola]
MSTDPTPTRTRTVGRSDRWFWGTAGAVCGLYLAVLGGLIAADAGYIAGIGPFAEDKKDAANPLWSALADPDIRHSLHLTLVSCSITSILSLLTATPIGYLLSRRQFRGRALVDTLLDVPIVLPPLAIGVSLLILFQTLPASLRDAVVYQTPAVIVAQYVVASAFAIRSMRVTFDQIDPRLEQVAQTLGASRLQAFGWVVLPEARSGMLSATLLAWARSLGEFGPLLVFAGATRGKTEVLSTTVFLELSIGDLRSAVAVSLLMIVISVAALTLARVLGGRTRD